MNRKDVILTEELHQAVMDLGEAEVKSLLAQGAQPSLLSNNTTALHLAVKKPLNDKNEEKALAILQMLLDKGGDINQIAAYRTAMNLAGHNSFWRAVLLIAANKKTDVHDSGHYGSALLDAVRFCHDEELLQNMVFTLLEQSARANRHSREDGYTALHWAVVKGRAFVLRMLLAKFPDEYLRKSKKTELHPKSLSPARMAFNLYLEYEQNSSATEAQRMAKKRVWECLWAIAEVAYLPIIKDEIDKWPDDLKKEKDIIFKVVCSLPPAEKWRAILDGQNDLCSLGRLNHTQTGKIPSFGDTTTVTLYKEEETKMRAQGYPDVLNPPLPKRQLRTSPQMFTSAPRIITNYVSVTSSSVGAEPVYASTPIFFFSPPPGLPPESGLSLRQQSPPIPIQRSLTPAKERRTVSSTSSGSPTPTPTPTRSPTPTPSPSTSPQEFLAELFADQPSSYSHSLDDDAIRGPHRF